MSPAGMRPPSFEKAAEQVKQQAREKQGQVREAVSKTEQGIEQVQQQVGAIKKAIGNIKNAIAQLRAQAAQNPQLKNHPTYQQRLNGYREKLKELKGVLRQREAQLEMLRKRKLQYKETLLKIAGQASSQLSTLKKRQAAQKQQQQSAQQKQKRKATKAESGKVRG